jgi:hypothetical protein
MYIKRNLTRNSSTLFIFPGGEHQERMSRQHQERMAHQHQAAQALLATPRMIDK